MIYEIQKWIMSTFIAYIMCVSALFLTIALYEYASADERWVTYEDGYSTQNQYAVGEPILMHSVVQVHRDVAYLGWKNDLRCGDDASSLNAISSYQSPGTRTEKKTIDTDWLYLVDGKLDLTAQPLEPSVCQMRLKITVQTPLIRQTKTAEFITPLFYFVWK